MRLPEYPEFARQILFVGLILPLLFVGCDLSSSNNSGGRSSAFNLDNCTIPTDRLRSGCDGPDCIPALVDPNLVGPDDDAADYIADGDRVIGLLFGDEPLAIPHNILWFHEVANFDWSGRRFAVTYCPLTGSSLAFSRAPLDGAQLRVSGLLFDNNLVMYDRQEDESLWPQMNRKANCGPQVGTPLPMLPVVEMTWDHWKRRHPDTKVVSNRTRYAFRYTAENYPYGNYEETDNDRLLFDMPIDDRRPPKERVLGIPNGSGGGIALPFGALDTNSVNVTTVAVGATEKTIFWSRAANGAMAFTTDDVFDVEQGRIVDAETGSVWSIEGRAIEGPRKGEQLTPVDSAYVAFWFAWAAFHPQTAIWSP